MKRDAREPSASGAQPLEEEAPVKKYSSARSLYPCLDLRSPLDPPFRIGLPATFDEVVEWARDDIGVDAEDAPKLKVQKIDGQVLSLQSRYDPAVLAQVYAVCDIPAGPATRIYEGLRELFPLATATGRIVVPVSDFSEGWRVDKVVIRNVIQPQYFFECDLLIDTACLVGGLLLPLRKIQQIHLVATYTKQVQEHGAGTAQVYSPVRLELRASNGAMITTVLEPFTTPCGAGLNTCLTAEEINPPAGPDAPSIPISPVKLPKPVDRTDLDTPLLGAGGLRALGVGLDVKNQCLYQALGFLL